MAITSTLIDSGATCNIMDKATWEMLTQNKQEKARVVADRTRSSSDTAPEGAMESCGIRVHDPHSSRAEIPPDRERGVCTCVGVRKISPAYVWTCIRTGYGPQTVGMHLHQNIEAIGEDRKMGASFSRVPVQGDLPTRKQTLMMRSDD